jgi:hypothetical protein
MASGNITRDEIRRELEGFVIEYVEMGREYLMNHPHLKPENYGRYLEYKAVRDRQPLTLKEQDVADKFDSYDIFKKISELRDLYDSINRNRLNFISLGNVQVQRDIISGKNKIPYQSEILVKLGLASDDKVQMVDIAKQIDSMFTTILNVRQSLVEIQKTMLSTRGLTINDIPMLTQEFIDKYNDVTREIEDLEQTKIQLIDKFTKMNEERKNISIDKIVAKFAETNDYLNYKLPKEI